MSHDYLLSNVVPSPEEYCALRKSVGLSEMTLSAAREALPRTLFMVSIRDKDTLIGMGRVVGDKGCFLQVVDIAVSPDYQKQGLSRRIMESIMHFIENEVPKCAVVSLFSDVDYLYQKFGFDTPKVSQGMFLKRS